MKIWIAIGAVAVLAGCSYLPSADILNSAPPDKQMSYRFDTSQTAAEPAPEEQPAAGKKAAKKQQMAKRQRAKKDRPSGAQPEPEPATPAEDPQE